VARISGIATRYASWHGPTALDIAAAITELHAVAGNRPELLAEVAGIQLSFHQRSLDEPEPRLRLSCSSPLMPARA